MAHADYDCCAVCDNKQSYSHFSAKTKEEVCSRCVANLAQLGVIVHDADALLEWIKSNDAPEVFITLKAVGFRACYYDNDIDMALEELGEEHGVIFDENRRLKAIENGE